MSDEDPEERAIHPRVGRIVCDDEIGDELVAVIEKWILTYQAEVCRQRGLAPDALERPFQIIPVEVFEDEDDIFPSITVQVERTSDSTTGQGRDVSFDWRVVVEVGVSGVDAADTRKRLGMTTAAVRALLVKHGTGEFVSKLRFAGTTYSPVGEMKGRTVGVSVTEYRCGVHEALNLKRGGLRQPLEDPYGELPGLGTVEAVKVSVERA